MNEASGETAGRSAELSPRFRASHGSAFVSYSLRFPGNAADLSVKTVYTNRPERQYLLPETPHARPEFFDGKSAGYVDTTRLWIGRHKSAHLDRAGIHTLLERVCGCSSDA